MSIRKPREQDLVKPCLQYLAMVGVFAWRQNQGALVVSAMGHHARRFARFAGVKGISDIIGILPAPQRGRFLAVELKQPGEEPTDDQARFLAAVDARGGLALVVQSLAELEADLRDEGIGV